MREPMSRDVIARAIADTTNAVRDTRYRAETFSHQADAVLAALARSGAVLLTADEAAALGRVIAWITDDAVPTAEEFRADLDALAATLERRTE